MILLLDIVHDFTPICLFDKIMFSQIKRRYFYLSNKNTYSLVIFKFDKRSSNKL